jgi:hypothetical protein
MSLIGALDKTKHFDEFDEPLFSNEGVLTPSTRKARARANLDVSSSAEAFTANNGIINVPAGGAAVDLAALPSGGTILIPLVTANVTTTLPAATTTGLTFEFVFAAGATADAEDWVITSPSAYIGGLVWMTSGTPDIELVAAATTIMTINNPNAGTRVKVVANGTTWVVMGTVMSANTPAFS